MNYNQDCIYFLSDRPCKFHKKNSKILCLNCKFYKPINKKILIIKLAALGDVVRTTCILKPLYKKYKNSKIYWITENNAVEILQNNPYIYEIIPYDGSFQLFNYKFDILINLDLDTNALRLTKNIFAEKKYGFYLDQKDNILCSNKSAEKWFELSHNDELKKQNKKTYQEFLMEILEFKNLEYTDYPIIINLTKEEKLFAEKFIHDRIKNKTNFYFIGINLGGGDKWQKKEYPAELTVQLIRYILESKELKKDVKILLFGGKKEEDRNKKIISLISTYYPSLINKIIDTKTENTLRQFFALLNLCDILVTSDTMALHIALALKKKVVALFGPTSYNEIEMYGLGKKIVSSIDCVVCYNRSCSKKLDCMQKISPKMIYKEIINLLK
ncbi:MAG: glycosyltransferase family 9 protein [Endomicrobiia bacterium]